MDAVSFYRDVEEQICQGDIFMNLPHLILKDPAKAPQPIKLGDKKAGYLLDELCGPQFPLQGTDVSVPSSCLIERAVLLTYNCEIDKDKRHRTIALIRPLTSLKEAEKETIRRNGKYACFYLPPLGDQIPEGYIDFRRVCTVAPYWLDRTKRITSLSETARRLMFL